MASKTEHFYFIPEAELREDLQTLYTTDVFPERLASNLMKMVDGSLHNKRFIRYTQDWKEEMQSAALQRVVDVLRRKKFDLEHNSSCFSWITQVIFNRFKDTITSLQKEHDREQGYVELAKTDYEMTHNKGGHK